MRNDVRSAIPIFVTLQSSEAVVFALSELTKRLAEAEAKNSYGNRSERGADCQAVMMTVFRTLKQRGYDPIRSVVAALQHYLLTNQLPPLPSDTHRFF